MSTPPSGPVLMDSVDNRCLRMVEVAVRVDSQRTNTSRDDWTGELGLSLVN
jgi:hypothetical protein